MTFNRLTADKLALNHGWTYDVDFVRGRLWVRMTATFPTTPADPETRGAQARAVQKLAQGIDRRIKARFPSAGALTAKPRKKRRP